ncbi:MAG: hypothetical protein IPN29_03445 [Saprospiraceae bacterium]|nr:hypothetical protein [Saprospiraceae bacterium]
MRIFLLTGLLLWSAVVIVRAQECRYENYFYLCHAASADIKDGAPEKAVGHYKRAFAGDHFPFGIHLHEALNLAIQMKDTTWMKGISIQLAKGGVPLTFFAKLKDQPWYSIFEQSFPEYAQHFKNHFDLELRKQLLELRTKDSLFNISYHRWRKGEIELSLESLIADATGLSSGFIQLVKKYGFPCEQKMGYYMEEDKIADLPVAILLHHLYQFGEMILRDHLTEMVCDGKLRPQQQAQLIRVSGFGNGTGIEQEMQIRYGKRMGNRN